MAAVADAADGVRSWPLLLLAAPAFVAIWAGWVGLGGLTGFGLVHPLPGTPLADWTLNTAVTLPIGVEAYAAYALRVWLTAPAEWGPAHPAVQFARVSAIASLGLGAAGQVAYHLMTAAQVTRAPWWIVTLVACLPVAVLGMGAALAHLIRQPAAIGPRRTGADVAAPVPPSGESAVAQDLPADTTPDTGTDSTPDAAPDSTPDIASPVRVARTADPSVRSGAQRSRRTADAVARLRRTHPDMPTMKIAQRLGVTDRTVRRHLADLAATTTQTATEATR